MRLLPREEKFFHLFSQQVELISQASALLLEGTRAGNSRLIEVAKKIIDLEHRGDEIIHEIFTKLNQTFITPFDPEDIHNLSSKLDDVLDGIEEAAHRMVAYRLDAIPEGMIVVAWPWKRPFTHWRRTKR
jgi:predicted phosphate transport protein (TIGR00153 family)